MRAVRSQQHGNAVCGHGTPREKQTLFGDFLPFSKKLPASRRIAEAFSSKTEQQSKVAGFQRPLERRASRSKSSLADSPQRGANGPIRRAPSTNRGYSAHPRPD